MRYLLCLFSCVIFPTICTLPAADEMPAAEPIPGAPDWLKTYDFPRPEFTFVRIQYRSSSDHLRGPGRWATDYPDADINFSAQLAAQTKLKVNPQGIVLKLTDPNLPQFPFIYLAEPGALVFSEEEVIALREYLDDGGFLMVDDFWGEAEWENLEQQLKRVFPASKIKALPLEHQLFHCAFDLKEKPQVVSIHAFLSGNTTERFDAHKANYRAVFDDAGRMQVLICHNTDLADGWERSEIHPEYYREYSVKRSYPMGINAIFFALTQQ